MLPADSQRVLSAAACLQSTRAAVLAAICVCAVQALQKNSVPLVQRPPRFFLTRSEPRSSCHDGRSAGRKNSVLSSFNRSKQSGDVNRNQACLRTVASSVYRKFI